MTMRDPIDVCLLVSLLLSFSSLSLCSNDEAMVISASLTCNSLLLCFFIYLCLSLSLSSICLPCLLLDSSSSFSFSFFQHTNSKLAVTFVRVYALQK